MRVFALLAVLTLLAPSRGLADDAAARRAEAAATRAEDAAIRTEAAATRVERALERLERALEEAAAERSPRPRTPESRR